MDGLQHGGANNYYEDEGDHEMIAFLPQERNDKNLKKMRTESKLRPLEILVNSNKKEHRRIPQHTVIHPHNDSASSPLSCRVGYFLLVVGCLLGLWYWSGHEISANTVVEAWHSYRLRDIKNWCLDPGSKTCNCANPLEPKDRIGHKTWEQAHLGNIQEAEQASGIDVVFLGDSLIEGWKGMSMGIPVHTKRANLPVFNELFKESKGADFEGLALGISGDKSPNLLWRIQNGEVPDTLQPSVWWILIGTNDFLREDHCSAEVVLMGVKRVVDEMRRRRPGSIIVVNGILPRSEDDLQGKLFDPGHPSRLTVWQGISAVNRELRIYCSHFRNVVFFDATSIFLKGDNTTSGVEGMYIPSILMGDYIHPTPLGYKQWGEAIKLAIHHLTDASTVEKGRKPLPHRWWEFSH